MSVVRCFVGSDSGIVKESVWQTEEDKELIKTENVWGVPKRDASIQHITRISDTSIAFSQESGAIFRSQPISDMKVNENPDKFKADLLFNLEASPIGISKLSNTESIVCGSRNGSIHILNGKSSSFKVGLDKNGTSLINKDKYLTHMDVHNDHSSAAIGGKSFDLQLWDLETQEMTFKAKNIPETKLRLQAPIWIRKIKFLNESPFELITGTSYGEVRLYDTRTHLRPVLSKAMSEHPITALDVAPSGICAIFGDSCGSLCKFDLRRECKEIGKYKGLVGSVRDVRYTDSGRYIGAVGLGMYLKVFEESSRKCCASVYLKEKLNCLLVHEIEAVSKEQDAATVDELWEMLDEVETKPKKRKVVSK